jgi:hypothetical protein
VQVTPETLNNPEAFQKFQQAQGELSSALSRLLVVSERYPTLQANQGFRDLRVQLEGTENRITVARNRYIQAVQQYNVLARSFPTQPDGDGVRLTAQGELHGAERSARSRCRRPWTSASPRRRRRACSSRRPLRSPRAPR